MISVALSRDTYHQLGFGAQQAPSDSALFVKHIRQAIGNCLGRSSVEDIPKACPGDGQTCRALGIDAPGNLRMTVLVPANSHPPCCCQNLFLKLQPDPPQTQYQRPLQGNLWISTIFEVHTRITLPHLHAGD